MIENLKKEDFIRDKDFYTNAQGRVSRKDFLLGWIVPSWGFLILVNILDGFLTQGLLAALAGLAVIYPAIVVSIRRCHDRGRTGWFLLLSLIPFIGFIWYIVDLMVLPGETGPNQYGEDPLA